MSTFKERYVAAYNQMLEVLEELAERALKFQKKVESKGFWVNVDSTQLDSYTSIEYLNPENKRTLTFRTRGDFFFCENKNLLEDDLEKSISDYIQAEKERKKQQAAEAAARKNIRLKRKAEIEKKLLEELKAKYEKS